MPSEAEDFMALASSLLGDGKVSEAHRRAAINRAYYAAYHEALSFADDSDLEIVRSNTGSHQQLVARFSSAGKRHKIIGDRLAALKKMRADADYKIEQTISTPDAQKHIQGCQRLIQELMRLRESRLANVK
ncbi:MAG TPA: hypothetical protein VL178_13430 [Pseudomonas sp.]|nr:hypothetical protein [Pseudomonas sp.]